ncbi:hypothetical protein Tco_0911315 [Tanacetum coccineum]|uniref:Uncharacterized protein n=1 Tax=Tanacetum coccineum TaxID=301880 RepID=A0ABQ5CVF5_9ASTR
MGSCGVTIEGLYYRFINQHLLIPYPRIYKDHRQSLHTIFSDISRLLETVSLLARYDIMKNIFNSGRHKNKVGMQIPAWMITDEMKQTEHYRMYAEVFGIVVPLTLSQLTESTQGMHRTPSAPRRSTRLTPPTLVPTVDKADELILQDTLQVSLAEHKSREEQSKRNVTLVDEHIEPRSDKESPEVEIAKEKEVEISKEKEVELTNVVIPVNTLPAMVDKHIKEQVVKQVPKQVWNQVPVTSVVRPRDQDDPHDDAHPEGENRAKRQKTVRTMMKLQLSQVSQDIMEEVSLTIDEAKLRKIADEMLRQRCTLGDEHQYHIDHMKNFLKSDINPEAPALSLINQDLLYLKKGNSGAIRYIVTSQVSSNYPSTYRYEGTNFQMGE